MSKKIIKEYKTCPNCGGKGGEIDIEGRGIFGTVFSAYFGGLRNRCNMCKGNGRVVEKEEIIEE